MAQMQGMVQQLQEQVKKLKGDLQTAERENVHSKKQVEAQKFKSQLKEVLTDSKFKSKVNLNKLERVISAEEDVLKASKDRKKV